MSSRAPRSPDKGGPQAEARNPLTYKELRTPHYHAQEIARATSPTFRCFGMPCGAAYDPRVVPNELLTRGSQLPRKMPYQSTVSG